MRLHRYLYDWVLHWSRTPYGSLALFLIAVAESSFFPIPPDVLLIALCLATPLRSFSFALICSIGSVLGGLIGYLIGFSFFELIAEPIINFYRYQNVYARISELYNRYNAWVVGIAGFTPIPYKIFTIAGGACKINLVVFTLASIISRSARFYLVSFLLWRFGSPIRNFIEKYLGWLSILFVFILVLSFILLRYLL
ncbi:MAG: YqaA family protein [Acidobacteriota bacterium]